MIIYKYSANYIIYIIYLLISSYPVGMKTGCKISQPSIAPCITYYKLKSHGSLCPYYSLMCMYHVWCGVVFCYLSDSVINLCPQCNIQVHSLDVFRAHKVEHIEVKVKKNYMYSLVGMSLFQVAEKMWLVGREFNSFGSN